MKEEIYLDEYAKSLNPGDGELDGGGEDEGGDGEDVD